MALTYRRDIDGLRALAVLPVILFHAKFEWVSGGFVGVDVFFVISGYLITSILASEIAAGEFSIVRFYERRARRILPALYAVLIPSCFLSLILLPPFELELAGKSVIATVIFLSNVLFWKNKGYFDGPTEEQPFLHTWSLAVEEQFYFIFPLFLLLGFKWLRKGLAPLLVALIVVSFGASMWGVEVHPKPTFFLLPFRAWELGIGSLLALSGPWVKGAKSLQVAGGLGLIMIIYPCIQLTPESPFPGVNALMPCLGAVLLLDSGRATTYTSKLLGSLPLVWIGKISYSLYLWHWPLLTLLRWSAGRELTIFEALAVLAISCLLAKLSLEWVENPFRGRRGQWVSRRNVFAVALVSSLAVGVAGLFATYQAQSKLAPYADSLEKQEMLKEFSVGTGATLGRCDIGGPSRLEAACAPPMDQKPDFVVWGDSHVLALEPGIALMAQRKSKRGFIMAEQGCPPLIGVQRVDTFGDAQGKCRQAATRAEELIERWAPEVVILVARWNIYTTGWTYKGELRTESHLLAADKNALEFSVAESQQLLPALLRSTIETLSAASRVVLVLPPPELADHPANLADGHSARIQRAHMLKNHRERTSAILSLARKESRSAAVSFIDLAPVFCPNDLCVYRDGDHFLYRDDNHLAYLGALRVAPLLETAFQE